MSDHTPGPWDCHQAFETLEQNLEDREWKPARVYAGQHPVCDIKVIKIGKQYEKNHSPQEVNANAVLIAASPDLLNSCKELLAYVEAERGWEGEPDAEPMVMRGRDAIAAALQYRLCRTCYLAKREIQ